MDVTTLKHAYGPWGHSDRWVYQPPFGDYVYRAVSGFGQEGGGSLTPAFIGFLVGIFVGQSIERGSGFYSRQSRRKAWLEAGLKGKG